MNEPEPNMEQKCPQCGAPLPSGVLAGLCPACLFKQGATADTGASPESTVFHPPTVEELGQLFPQLEILALLGKGGMGAVYKARQPGLDRIVALKILPAHAAGGPGFIERFNREARALAKLNHPNIVAVYEFGQANNLPFFVMEFVDGLNLRQLEQAGKLSPREALQIVPQICDALQFAHDEGIVHRDIKPENILLDKKGRVKIADFGIAKILSSEPEVAITETGGAVGTPHYMAPEQMEKPTTVDHRADIFSLGVVFYEMLTGELPLGKFAPPSSRKVEVDVRLDDVVLRALEKDPELRYQRASQVKTAVDTIAGSAPPPPTAPPVNADALAREILARDYNIEIKKCLRRGWALVKSDFWPIVGVTALLIALLGFASSIGGVSSHGPAGASSVEITSGLSLLVWGPLMGGLYFYFLKKIRREKTTVETAFSGFSNRFLNLFLAGFVTSMLTTLGFLCFILPGIYLLIAWGFALPLVMDKHLDFWSAMELSRKVITRHWWKFLGLALVSLLLLFAGVIACVVGVFVASPLVLASLMYAYEDIFAGLPAAAAAAAPAGLGPFGTVVSPGGPPPIKPGTPPAATPMPPPPPGIVWTPATKIGLGAVGLVLLIALIITIHHQAVIAGQAEERRAELDRQHRDTVIPTPPAPPAPPAELIDLAPAAVFGPVIEKDLQTRATGTNLFLNLGAAQLLTPSVELRDLLTAGPGEDVSRIWKGLDIPKDSRRFQYLDWLRENGCDLMFAGDGKIAGFDGVFAIAHGDSSTNWDDWDSLTADQANAAVAAVDWEQRALAANKLGQPAPAAPKAGGVFRSAPQIDSREEGGPRVNLLTRDQSMNWYFKTRSGAVGILQLVGFTDTTAKIRYKLVQPPSGNPADSSAARQSRKNSEELLNERLDAASNISGQTEKDRALTAIVMDAVSAGEADIAQNALGQVSDQGARDQATQKAAIALARSGLRKQAIEMAKGISEQGLRDQTLGELAQ